MPASAALALRDTVQEQVGVSRVYIMLGRELTLAGMAAVVAQFREARQTSAAEIAIDGEKTERMTEGARLFLRDLVLRAQGDGVEVSVLGHIDVSNRLTVVE